MLQIQLSLQQRERITEILRKNGVVVAYIFGSYSRGTAGPLSDIDLGVIFSRQMSEVAQEEHIEYMRYALEKMFGRDKVDILNISTLKKPLLRYIITLGQGKIIFCYDEEVKNRISLISLREYEDTKVLRRIQSDALQKMFIQK